MRYRTPTGEAPQKVEARENKPHMRNVIFAELAPHCKSVYFVILECGHFQKTNSVYRVPARRKCWECANKSPWTISFMHAEWRSLVHLLGETRLAIRDHDDKRAPQIRIFKPREGQNRPLQY